MRNIYLDHSSTTPVDAEVLQAMLPFFSDVYGNAASIHRFGQEAKVALEEARQKVAQLMNAQPAEIIWTSSGTESDNWAVKGATAILTGRGQHIVTSNAEHPAVLKACEYLETVGFRVTYIAVGASGMVSADQVHAAISENTSLVTIMHANNEIGTINPISEIAVVCRQQGVLFHTDAVQSFGKIPLDVKKMNVDLLSASSHKIYGPKGIGVLYVRQGLRMENLLHGGKQERDRRAGTENVASAVGFGKAAEICAKRMANETRQIRDLRDTMQRKIWNEIPGVHLNGHAADRHPGILNLSFEGIQTDALLMNLDLQGVAASNGSACTSGSLEASHVLSAIGLPENLSKSAVRFSLGRQNTLEEIDYTVGVLKETVARLRRLSSSRKAAVIA